jgi:hypothetical protein
MHTRLSITCRNIAGYHTSNHNPYRAAENGKEGNCARRIQVRSVNKRDYSQDHKTE